MLIACFDTSWHFFLLFECWTLSVGNMPHTVFWQFFLFFFLVLMKNLRCIVWVKNRLELFQILGFPVNSSIRPCARASASVTRATTAGVRLLGVPRGRLPKLSTTTNLWQAWHGSCGGSSPASSSSFPFQIHNNFFKIWLSVPSSTIKIVLKKDFL